MRKRFLIILVALGVILAGMLFLEQKAVHAPGSETEVVIEIDHVLDH